MMHGEVIDHERHDDDGNNVVYQYKPMTSPRNIRLVKLAPGDRGAPLQCSLIQVDSDMPQQYEAMSYAWGDPDDRRDIACDGRRLPITRNLHEALWHFRHVNQPKYLWADAISINQQDMSERSAQVQLMANIYSKASKVLLWLGAHESEAVDAAFAVVNQFQDFHMEGFRKQSLRLSYQHIEDYVHTQGDDTINIDRATNITLGERLLRTPAFQRGWITQEIALAPLLDVCSGHISVDFDWMYAALTFTSDPLYSIHNWFNAVMPARVRLQSGQGIRLGFAFILESMREFHFSDDRDKVYGLLALLTRPGNATQEQTSIIPDYAVGTLKAYKQAIEYILFKDEQISILSLICHTNGLDERWPSWVPNFEDWSWYLRDGPSRNGKRGNSAKASRPAQSDQDCISIPGTRVGTIQSFDSTDISSVSDQDLQSLLGRLTENHGIRTVAYVATAGREVLPDEENGHNEAYNAFLHLNVGHVPLPTEFTLLYEWPEDPNTLDPAHLYGYYCRQVTHRRRFFLTESGMLGLGPAIMHKDDVFVVFSEDAYHSPGQDYFQAVLRRVGNLWRLVGPCYVYDIYTEEGRKLMRDRRPRLEQFNIY
jgi:hypothetical protein